MQHPILDPQLGGQASGTPERSSNREGASSSRPSPYHQSSNVSAPHLTPRHQAISAATTLSHSPSDAELISPHEESADVDGGQDTKKARSCESCRGLKVRCDQDPDRPDIPCKRCAKAGRQCIITQPTRKRQRKADGRVAELERKLDALTAAIQQQHNIAPEVFKPTQASPSRVSEDIAYRTDSRTSSQRMIEPHSQRSEVEPAVKRVRVDATPAQPQMHATVSRLEQQAQEYPTQSVGPKDEETISRGFSLLNRSWQTTNDVKQFLGPNSSEDFVKRINALIPPETAAAIFDRYVNDYAPHLPVVVFPPGTTAAQVWKTKPVVYVCILAAASAGKVRTEIIDELNQEAIGAIADCTIRNGAKSLELIQAMQVQCLWYKPPEKAAQTNFYQIIHMAAVMGLDIGLNKRFNAAKARRGFGGPHAHCAPGTQNLPQDSGTIEARRAWLGCYYLCASASMVLRRPNLVRWTNYMNECIEVLETHPDALPSDKLFCQHVKNQRICEDIGSQFLMDDSTANISITDPKVTYALNVFENDLKTWKENIPSDCHTPGLEFFQHVTSLYLHEIALHFNHNVEDFKLPFTEESLKASHNLTEKLTQHQVAALEACVKSSHGILDTILAYKPHAFKTLPMLIFFVRCVYAIVILIKMHVAINGPGSEVGKLMKADDLRVEYYISCVMQRYTATDDEDFRPWPKIIIILSVLRDWFQKHKENLATLGSSDTHPIPSRQQQAEGYQSQHAQHERKRYSQTPLDLLSQVATSSSMTDLPVQSRDIGAHTSQQPPSWNMSASYPNQYNNMATQGVRQADFNHPRSTLTPTSAGMVDVPRHAQSNTNFNPGFSGDQSSNNLLPDMYGWGTGFEQAMDIAMGGMSGLAGGGVGMLDDWFLGDFMAPYTGFQGDLSAAGNSGGDGGGGNNGAGGGSGGQW